MYEHSLSEGVWNHLHAILVWEDINNTIPFLLLLVQTTSNGIGIICVIGDLPLHIHTVSLLLEMTAGEALEKVREMLGKHPIPRHQDAAGKIKCSRKMSGSSTIGDWVGLGSNSGLDKPGL